MFDYLIVGAGFGSVLAERLASQSDKKIWSLTSETTLEWSLRCCRHSRPQVRSPHFHTNSREVFEYLSHFTEWRSYESTSKCGRSARTHPTNLDTVNRLYGQISPHSRLRSSSLPRSTSAHPRMVVSKVAGTVREVLPWLHPQAMGHWPIWTRQVGHRPRSHPHKPWRSIFHRYVSGDAPVRIYPMFERCCRTQTSKSCSTLIIGRLWGYTVPGDDLHVRLMNSSITATESYLTARWSSDTQHACASNSCSRELSEWASIHPRHRVQILTGQEHAKTSIVYEYPRESEIHTTPYRVQRTLNSTRNTRHWLMQRQAWISWRLATYKYYNMDQVVAQALTMYSRLQVYNWDLQENVDQKLVPVQSSVAKTFEDIKSW